ncbi:MAG: type II toxin-antitoxin system RelB/DinJ family antitoxin [Prevotella sp.]|nr:type II toxin-antitoxin system RelB/DinJ family antitoxin [Prevotella sp.]
MAQVSMTVRLDSQVKQRFDALCNEIGMSANTAMNIFVRRMISFGGIPFEVSIKKPEDFIHDEGVKAFREMRAMAEAGLFPDLTLDEINEEIRLAREERAEREKISV